jgi:hypothetical protein
LLGTIHQEEEEEEEDEDEEEEEEEEGSKSLSREASIVSDEEPEEKPLLTFY